MSNLPRPSGLPRRIPAWAWKALKLPGRHLPHKKPAWFWVWRAWRLHLHIPRPKPKPKPLTMYDSVSVHEIPADAVAVAGYVGGQWQTFQDLEHGWPNAHRLSIAIAANEDAHCLDIERGDATIPEAAAWVKRQHARGLMRPVVYTSISYAPALVQALRGAGLRYGSDYLYWSAHYTNHPHLCHRGCGYDFGGTAHATQYTMTALGRNLDASLCSGGFFA